MTRSSDAPWYTSTPVVLLTAALTAVICAGATRAAVTGEEGRVGMVVLALFTGSVSLMMLASLGRGTGAWSTTELDGRPAWQLRLGPSGPAAWTVVAVLLATGLGLALGALAVGERSVGGGVVVGVLALAVLLLALELGRAAARAPALVIGVDRLHHRGAGLLVDLAWDDVSTIEWAHVGTRRACLRIGAVVGATSHRATRRPSLLPLDHVPDQPGIELRMRLLPDAPAVLRTLRELELGGRATRESLLSRGAPSLPPR